MESCRLAELKYAFFSRTEPKTKELQRSNGCPSMVFEHGLLEGTAILFQHSSTSRTPLESSRIGELKYAISAGYDVRLKNKSFWKGKLTLRTWSLYCEQVWTGLAKFEQVRTAVKHCFSSTVSRTLSKFGLSPKPARSFLTVPRSKLYGPPKLWKQPFVMLHLV